MYAAAVAVYTNGKGARRMKKEELWQTFYRTGRVEDYLHYRQACRNAKEDAHAPDNRRDRDPGKQQYR